MNTWCWWNKLPPIKVVDYNRTNNYLSSDNKGNFVKPTHSAARKTTTARSNIHLNRQDKLSNRYARKGFRWWRRAKTKQTWNFISGFYCKQSLFHRRFDSTAQFKQKFTFDKTNPKEIPKIVGHTVVRREYKMLVDLQKLYLINFRKLINRFWRLFNRLSKTIKKNGLTKNKNWVRHNKSWTPRYARNWTKKLNSMWIERF